MKALALVVLTGCSFVLTKGPDTGEPPRAYPSCTTSMTWPVVDGIFSALFLTAMIGAITEDDQMSNLQDGEANKASKITTSALFMVAAAAGAYVGYQRVSRCRSSQERFMQQNPMQPYSYPYAYPQQQPYYPPPQYQQPQPQQQPPPPAAPIPQQQPAASALGTEGDVCASSAECAAGLACTKNVCVRPPPDSRR